MGNHVVPSMAALAGWVEREKIEITAAMTAKGRILWTGLMKPPRQPDSVGRLSELAREAGVSLQAPQLPGPAELPGRFPLLRAGLR
jgi:hypothetical protein